MATASKPLAYDRLLLSVLIQIPDGNLGGALDITGIIRNTHAPFAHDRSAVWQRLSPD